VKKSILVLLPVIMLLAPGCILIDHENPGCIGSNCNEYPGDIRFYWAFELADGSSTDWCNVADIARIDLVIYDDWGDLEFEAYDLPCGDMGAIIDNFWPGTYELQLSGICSSGRITHEGWWEFDVYEGTNDYGTVVLDYVGRCY